MIKIFIFGISGKIGKLILKFIKLFKNIIIIGGINSRNFFLLKKYNNIFINMKKNGVFIDFSNDNLINIILKLSTYYKVPLIIGTTGFSFYNLKLIKEFSKKIPIIISYNMSIGINILNYIFLNIGLYLKKYNFESFIFDIHHKKKKDVPSGTLLMLSSKIFNKNIFSCRIKKILGIHIVYFISKYEIIKIEHFILNKKIFFIGIMFAIFWILKKKLGCYSMYDVYFR